MDVLHGHEQQTTVWHDRLAATSSDGIKKVLPQTWHITKLLFFYVTDAMDAIVSFNKMLHYITRHFPKVLLAFISKYEYTL